VNSEGSVVSEGEVSKLVGPSSSLLIIYRISHDTKAYESQVPLAVYDES